MWERVTIVGCGLIGASFALALRRAGACARFAGWDSNPRALEESLRLGVIDEPDEAFEGGGLSSSDLVYLAMPVGRIVEFLRAGARGVGPGTLLTDAGSTKAEVCRAAHEGLRPSVRFVGGHPVAGSHLRGAAHARADLFEGAPYVLTPAEDGSDACALEALGETLRLLGARVRVMRATEHDRALAFVSHLPQLASGALAATVGAEPDADALRDLAGTGYRDTTRLAASAWGVWHDILATNSDALASALDAYITKLSAARDELRQYARAAEAQAETAEDGDRLEATRALFDQPRTN